MLIKLRPDQLGVGAVPEEGIVACRAGHDPLARVVLERTIAR